MAQSKWQEGNDAAMQQQRTDFDADTVSSALEPAPEVEELEVEAKSALDLFLFEDVVNNRNYHENDWGITWEGDDFVLYHHETGKVYNFRVELTPGHLTEERIKELVKDQEWDDE